MEYDNTLNGKLTDVWHAALLTKKKKTTFDIQVNKEHDKECKRIITGHVEKKHTLFIITVCDSL